VHLLEERLGREERKGERARLGEWIVFGRCVLSCV